jgi:hypothetical protein
MSAGRSARRLHEIWTDQKAATTTTVTTTTRHGPPRRTTADGNGEALTRASV